MDSPEDKRRGYSYSHSGPSPAHEYLVPKVLATVERLLPVGSKRIFDLGCGNGFVAEQLALRGYDVSGVDSSSEAIHLANETRPQLCLQIGSVYDDLEARFGTFSIVISLEVVEHVYAPREYARTMARLLDRGGIAIISTPFHGYWKNLALALSGRLDEHFTALWDHGHIKFWSIMTLQTLLSEAGLETIEVQMAGRFPPLSKSMILVARKR